MNIFELIVADPNSYHQLTNDYTQHSNNWTLFKQNLNSIPTHQTQEVDHLLSRSK